MNFVGSHDNTGILHQVRSLGSQESLVFGVHNPPSLAAHSVRVVREQGKPALVVPFANTNPVFEPFGQTELAGTSIVPDAAAHRDSRPSNILNVHQVVSGSLTARFALLPDELHDDYLDLGTPMAELGNEFAVQTVQARAGSILCFLGGVVTHEFTSAPDCQRLSIIRNFTVDEATLRPHGVEM